MVKQFRKLCFFWGGGVNLVFEGKSEFSLKGNTIKLILS